jgi:hypothetical protein
MNNPIVKVVLGIAVIVLAYALWRTIIDPIRYQEEVDRREAAIIERLTYVKDAQLAFKEVHGEFATNWDQLLNSVKNDNLKILSMTGDPEDSTSVVKVDTIFVSIMDRYFENVNVDSLKFVPFGAEGDTFLINAGAVKKNNVTVPVFEVVDPNPFSKKRIEENNPLRLGNMYDPIYTGNW